MPGGSWPASFSSSLASSSVTRANGSFGAATSVPKVSRIRSPWVSATAPSTWASHRSSTAITSSWESIHESSMSTLVNSVSWREVKDGLARNTGPISKTFPNPAAIAICL